MGWSGGAWLALRIKFFLLLFLDVMNLANEVF
jgi:hypothetical protein